MRSAAFVASALALLLACFSARCEEPKRPEDDLRTLGERFLDSLKDDNIVGCAQCWVSLSVAKRAANDARTPPEELRELPAVFLNRDRVISRQFQPLRDRLKALRKDMASIKLDTVLARSGGTLHGVRKWDDITIVLRIDSRTICKVDFDRAAEFGGEWYFVFEPEPRIRVLRRVEGGLAGKIVDVMTGEEEEYLPPSSAWVEGTGTGKGGEKGDKSN